MRLTLLHLIDSQFEHLKIHQSFQQYNLHQYIHQQVFVPYEFLGLDEATYKANIKEARTTRVVTRKASRPKKIVNTISGLDPDKVIQFLITEDVAPETIVKLVAEMNINSGTLMAELCKYMTKKTAEKQQTWRPTGYNTAEAQMSIKI